MAYESLINAGLLVIGLFILYKSGDYTVDGAIGISESLNLGKFAIGFIFIALATNAPEIFVSISSVIKGQPGLAVGNAIGSSLSNITIILGLAVLFAGTIYLKYKDTIDLIEMLFVAAIVPLFIVQARSFTIFHGVILLLLFVFFINKLKEEKLTEGDDRVNVKKFGKSLLVFSGAIVFLLISTEIVVRSALNLTNLLPVTPEFIGLTIIAIGTSLPELTVAITSIKEKEYGLATSNIFGSTLINLTLVLGMVGVLGAVLGSPVLDFESVTIAAPFLLLGTLTTWYFLSQKPTNIKKKNAYVLIGIFVLFLLNEIGLVFIFSRGG